jgi:hypothetical protein
MPTVPPLQCLICGVSTPAPALACHACGEATWAPVAPSAAVPDEPSPAPAPAPPPQDPLNRADRRSLRRNG